MDNPWLSVIVPTFNGERHLASALRSIAAQGDGGLEVIAIDDGSRDTTVEILRRFERCLPLQILASNRSGNWVSNSNRGLRMARGRWACFLHQDDLWFSGRLRTLRGMLAQHPTAALLLHSCWFVDVRGWRVGRWNCPLKPGMHRSGDVIPRLLVQNFVGLPAAAFRCDVARQVGGLDEELWYAADWDFWLKLSATGPTAYERRAVAGFRIHSQSQTAKRTVQTDEMQRQLSTVIERHQTHESISEETKKVARFAATLNSNLAATFHGARSPWKRLAHDCARLGPRGWHAFLRDSRLLERVGARLRARTWR